MPHLSAALIRAGKIVRLCHGALRRCGTRLMWALAGLAIGPIDH